MNSHDIFKEAVQKTIFKNEIHGLIIPRSLRSNALVMIRMGVDRKARDEHFILLVAREK